MSVADATAWPRRSVAMGRLIASELRLVFGRRRNQVGLATLFGLVVVLGVALKISAARHPGSRAGDLIAAVAGNGIFLGFAGLSLSLIHI